jgi:hypothetical protein
MLHNAYSKLVEQQLKRRHREWRVPAKKQMCGDDEVAIGLTWAEAVLYVEEHVTQNHTIQHRKVMLSSNQAEFLQYNMFSTGQLLPTQPLAPNIVNFVSGSWYKTAAYDRTEYPNQVAEAAASCIRRGAVPSTFMQLAISTCSWLCGETAWRQALMATNLFGRQCTEPNKTSAASITASQLQHATHPKSIGDYTKLLHKRYALSDEETKAAAEYAADNIFSGVLADLRATSKTSTYTHTIPRVVVPPEEELPHKILDLWLTTTQPQRIDTQTWMAVQLGVPLGLLKRIGTRQLISRAKNNDRKHINIPTAMPTTSLSPKQYAQLPGAIAPYFVC